MADRLSGLYQQQLFGCRTVELRDSVAAVVLIYLQYTHNISDISALSGGSAHDDRGWRDASAVTPGIEHDEVVMATVLDDAAGAVVADKGYNLPRNHKLLRSKRIDNRIIRRRGGGDNSGRYVVERVNAIVKRWCGGGRAR